MMTPIELIPFATARQQLGISHMTGWRWRKAGLLPEPTMIRGRNYYRRDEWDAAIDRLMSQPKAELNRLMSQPKAA